MLATETYKLRMSQENASKPFSCVTFYSKLLRPELFEVPKKRTANAKPEPEGHKLQYQEESRNELIASYHKVDISEMVEARTHVRGKISRMPSLN